MKIRFGVLVVCKIGLIYLGFFGRFFGVLVFFCFFFNFFYLGLVSKRPFFGQFRN